MNELLMNSKKRLGEIGLLSRIYHETRLRRSKTTQHSPILVYQMGKVGSRSIVDSLRAVKLNRPVYHVHFLNQDNIQKADQMLHAIYGSHYNVNRWCLYESRFVIKHFLHQRAKHLKIISLVREPVGRNISSFFHNIDKFIPNCAALYEEGKIDIGGITQRFLQQFHEHSFPLTWFDQEMKSVFGIDVFSANVVRSEEQRVFTYKHGELDLLVMKTEDIDDVAQKALQEFLQIKDFRLKQSNISRDKYYNRVYDDFVKLVKLPEEYLTSMFESKYAKYFYTSKEIELFRTRWARS
jgi:Putative capsular polysaccharide synthesis protein/Sulfotransferase family